MVVLIWFTFISFVMIPWMLYDIITNGSIVAYICLILQIPWLIKYIYIPLMENYL